MVCKKLSSLLVLVIFSALSCFAQQAQQETQQAEKQNAGDVDSEIEAARADLRADKVTIIKDVMKFTPEESAAFWPIYNNYENDLKKVNDERVALVKEYADKFTTLTDADAKRMTEKNFDLEARTLDLRKKYYKEFSKKLPATTATKFFQLEHRLDLLIDLKVASELPMLLVKPATTSTPQAQQ